MFYAAVVDKEATCLVDEQILRLEISVKDALLVAEGHATQQLVQERLQIYGLER